MECSSYVPDSQFVRINVLKNIMVNKTSYLSTIIQTIQPLSEILFLYKV